MAGQIIIFPKNIAVSGGTVSVNTTATNDFQSWQYGGILRSVYVKAPSVNAVFDFKITSPNSLETFIRKNITNILSESIKFMIRGTHTITIENASVDGLYKMEFGFEVGKG